MIEHELLLHVPPGQVMPQPPQLLASLVVLTQAFVAEQYVGYDGLVHESMHVVPLHAAVPFVGLVHATHDGPHAVASLFTHLDPHRCWPPTHRHTLDTHCSPPLQANWEPQPPQLLASFAVSTQESDAAQ